MVAGAGADDSAFSFFVGEGGHFVIGAADFEGADFLEVFAFDVDGGVVFLGEAFGELEGGVLHDAV